MSLLNAFQCLWMPCASSAQRLQNCAVRNVVPVSIFAIIASAVTMISFMSQKNGRYSIDVMYCKGPEISSYIYTHLIWKHSLQLDHGATIHTFTGNIGTLFHTSMGHFGTLASYLRRSLWNHCSIAPWGTLELLFHTFTGNFGTIAPYLHGRLWNHCSIPPWVTLEPLFHTSMWEFGPIVPYLHGGLWNHCSIPPRGTLEPLFTGNFGTIAPYLHGRLWNCCSIPPHPWGTLEPLFHTFMGNFGTIVLYVHGNFGTIVLYLHRELWNHCSIASRYTCCLLTWKAKQGHREHKYTFSLSYGCALYRYTLDKQDKRFVYLMCLRGSRYASVLNILGAKDACAHVHVKRTCNGKYTEKAKDRDPYIWAKERAVPHGNGHS